MPARRSLPEDPSLENLKKQAKGLQKAVRAGETESLAQVGELHPRAEAALAHFTLSEAQLVIARSYGFASWPKLKQHLEVVEQFLWDPPAGTPPEGHTEPPADTFVRLACLVYGDWHPSSAVKARGMLAEHPELARANVYAAATTGEVSAVRTHLDRNPALLNRKGGPLKWAPLLHACYSRLDSPHPEHSTLEVARLLLARGADPNAGFLWRGLVPPFTAITGAFGEGEDGKNQAPHRDCEALVRLLLEAGADPNDGQALYNRHFRKDDGHLKLLLAYGLGRDKGGPWYERLGERTQSPARLLVEELWSAARRGFADRVTLLVEHGVELNTTGLRDGRTPYEAAMRAGHHEIATYLLEHGARKVEMDVKEVFAAACIGGRRAEARALLEKDPKLLEQLGHHRRIELLHRAVEGDHSEGLRLMAELGFEMSGMTAHDGVGMNLNATPLHNAAWKGNLEMVQLLVELGADPGLRERNYNGTPLDWAAHNQQEHVVEYLAKLNRP